MSLGIKVSFKNTEGDDVTIYFNQKFFPLLANNQFSEFYDNSQEAFSAWLDGFQDRGSGLTFDSLERAYLKIVKTKPITGGTYIPLPFSKRSIANILNSDDKCFLWSIIANFHPQSRNKTRVSQYQNYEQHYTNMLSGFTFPMKLSDIPKIGYWAINVYRFENITDPSSILYLSHTDKSQQGKARDQSFLLEARR